MTYLLSLLTDLQFMFLLFVGTDIFADIFLVNIVSIFMLYVLVDTFVAAHSLILHVSCLFG